MSYYGLTFLPDVQRQPGSIAIIRVDPEEAAAPRMAVEALRDGGVVVFPTEEGYLVGCLALDATAVRRLCQITGATADRLLGFAATPGQAAALDRPPQPLRHPVPLALMRAAGGPLVATACPPGAAPAPSAQHVVFALGDAPDLVLDAGAFRRHPNTDRR